MPLFPSGSVEKPSGSTDGSSPLIQSLQDPSPTSTSIPITPQLSEEAAVFIPHLSAEPAISTDSSLAIPGGSTSSLDVHTPLAPASRAIGSFPFPRQTNSKPGASGSGSSRQRGYRSFSTGLRTGSRHAKSRDRFIPIRKSPTSSTKSFHMSKPLHRLSSSERLLRRAASNADPFTSTEQNRASDADRLAPLRIPPRRLNGVRVGSTGSTGVLSIRRDSDSFFNRQASVGAVWNVGGAATIPSPGPIAAVPNGRGGLLGSGTNAPMYSSRFLESNTPDRDLEKHEGRLALALDFDQASRVFEFSSPSSSDPSANTSSRSASGGSSRGRCERDTADPRVIWRDNEWSKDGSPTRKWPLECPFNGLTQICCRTDQTKTKRNQKNRPVHSFQICSRDCAH